MIALQSVSYTHLDVYKRQFLEYLDSFLAMLNRKYANNASTRASIHGSLHKPSHQKHETVLIPDKPPAGPYQHTTQSPQTNATVSYTN